MRTRRDILERIAVVAVACVAVALVAYKLAARFAAGPDWDAFSFLANAAQFAGRGYGYTEPARPPLISVITAVPLALGFFDERAIQVVDALLTLLALGGFYLLLRRRFARLLAACGALALLMSPPLWEWIGVGYTDLAAVGLCAWALYFAVRGTEDDDRWLVLAFPTLAAAALMRVTSLLFAFPLVVFLALRVRPFRQRRALGAGLLATVAFYLPFAVHYQRVVGDALYPFVAGTKVQEAGSASTAVREIASFVTSLHRLAAPAPLSAFALVALGLAAFGIVKSGVSSIRARQVRPVRAVLAAVVAVAAFYVARGSGLAGQQLAVAGGVYAVWHLLGSEARETQPGIVRRVPTDFALDAAMLAWFLGYLCFHESWAQRVTRYYITMAPGVIYLVLLGFRVLADEAVASLHARHATPAEGHDRSGRPLLDLAPLTAWTPLVLLLAAGLALNAVTDTVREPNLALHAARETSAWLQARPDITTATVYSDLWPATAWYLQRGVKAMPLFTDERAVAHELRVNRGTYYMTATRRQVDGYSPAFEAGSGRVFVASADRPALPRILYLGGGWENYLESLSDYGIHLQHAEGDYNLQGTAFLDAYEPSVLRSYDTIAAFGFLWHDRSSAERALEQWVSDGGTLVIDASANLEPPASLDASVLFDTVIRRGALPRDATVRVAPAFAGGHGDLDSLQASPFVTEDGKAWYGAAYEALPGSAPLKVLASAEGRPLIAQRDWGRGRVLWVGYNLAWHAYQTGNADEARLVSAVLNEALKGDAARVTER